MQYRFGIRVADFFKRVAAVGVGGAGGGTVVLAGTAIGAGAGLLAGPAGMVVGGALGAGAGMAGVLALGVITAGGVAIFDRMRANKRKK